jgi:hypothetical protein
MVEFFQIIFIIIMIFSSNCGTSKMGPPTNSEIIYLLKCLNQDDHGFIPILCFRCSDDENRHCLGKEQHSKFYFSFLFETESMELEY